MSFAHVIRKYNTLIDQLSKEALLLQEGPLLKKSLGEGHNYQLLKVCCSNARFQTPSIHFRCLYVAIVVLAVDFGLNVERKSLFL
jgi:hypothetical protein